MKTYLQSNRLESLPIAAICNLAGYKDTPQFEELGNQYAFKNKPWLYPQVLAHLGKWVPQRNPQGEYLLADTVRENVKTDLDRACWALATSKIRFVHKQSQGDALYYCRLVPIVMAAFKKYQGIKYSQWNRESVNGWGVEGELLKAMHEEVPDYPMEDLLEWRLEGLRVKSGRGEGSVRNPKTTYGIYGLPKEHVLGKGPAQLSSLGKMILLQTWCAHPENRNEYMILDPKLWDHLPPPLVEGEVSSPEVGKEHVTEVKPYKLPWEQ